MAEASWLGMRAPSAKVSWGSQRAKMASNAGRRERVREKNGGEGERPFSFVFIRLAGRRLCFPIAKPGNRCLFATRQSDSLERRPATVPSGGGPQRTDGSKDRVFLGEKDRAVGQIAEAAFVFGQDLIGALAFR